MARLPTLKPRLGTLNSDRLPTLARKAGTTEMVRGRAGVNLRREVAAAHGYRCVTCGLVWREGVDQIDHRIPREQGGSNDMSNLQPMCVACHREKTNRESIERAGKAPR